jgi:hypothetical protein
MFDERRDSVGSYMLGFGTDSDDGQFGASVSLDLCLPGQQVFDRFPVSKTEDRWLVANTSEGNLNEYMIRGKQAEDAG